MALVIRLRRHGSRKRPFYRIVVADARAPRDGRFVERLGTFDPMKAKDDAGRVVLDQEKAKSWIAVSNIRSALCGSFWDFSWAFLQPSGYWFS